jgi:hypothetical protein
MRKLAEQGGWVKGTGKQLVPAGVRVLYGSFIRFG